MDAPVTDYVKTDDGTYIAYQTLGEGPVDIVWQFEWFSNVDAIWQARPYAEWFRGLASFARLILHDRRGTGASSRSVAPPNLETRVADLLAVMDAVGSERAVLGASLEGGAPNVLLAATRPERVHSLFWWYPTPRTTQTPDYPWGQSEQALEQDMREVVEMWGTARYDDYWFEPAPGERAVAEVDRMPIGLLSRQTATPDVGIEIELIWRDTDVRGTLPSVGQPTLLMARDRDEDALTYLASLMPRAQIQLFPGGSNLMPLVDEQPAVLRTIREFIGLPRPPSEMDRVLATLLFTDIVGSTGLAAELGDTRWKARLTAHDESAKQEIERHHGTYVKSTGDGLLARFDGPARAVRCAQAIAQAVRPLGLEIRAGCHTGEVELVEDDVQGIAVHIGARVSALAEPSRVLVSQTVKDLVAGSGLSFEDAGEHELKGVPDTWRLYRVVS